MKRIAIYVALSISTSTAFADEHNKNMADIEAAFEGRVGVYAINTGSGKAYSYRANERFPLCSSFKAFLAAAVLKMDQDSPGVLLERVNFHNRTMEPHSPITEKFQSQGMAVGELAAATLQYSDNGAANLLMEKYIKGPEGMTQFMNSIGDTKFRLDRWELDLNSAIPGDERDTSTPKAVAESLNKLISNAVLDNYHQEIFKKWMIGNTTGGNRIRAAVPDGWVVGDKTGTCGNYGTANDHAFILQGNNAAPLILSIYTTRKGEHMKHDDEVIAKAARIAIENVK